MSSPSFFNSNNSAGVSDLLARHKTTLGAFKIASKHSECTRRAKTPHDDIGAEIGAESLTAVA